MKRIQQAVLGSWLLAGFGVSAPAEELPRGAPAEAGMSAAKLEKVKATVQSMVDKEQTAGAIILVARHGKVVLLESFGKMDVAAGKRMRDDTIFRIYSMTKPITTVAAMLLWEENRFQLDDPIAKYLPELKGLRVLAGKGDDTVAAKREMTIRDLMRHTSGLIYDGMPPPTPLDKLYGEKKVMDHNGTLADMVEKLGKLPLAYQPGTRFNYSISTDVLGRLVEVISGKPLDEFFQERIFGPLDMKDTGFFVPDDKAARFAANYGPSKDHGLQVIDAPATSSYRKRPKFFSGGGGLVSTARDYLRFSQMMLNGGQLQGTRLLRPETVRQMTTNQLPAEALPMKLAGIPVPSTGFGLGFSVRLPRDPKAPTERHAGEFGWSGAASTHFWICPKPDVVVVAMQQFMPFSMRLELAIKPLIYEAVLD
jgi:CubicO group peptidase (beta-lactamase class C family)